MSIKSPKKDPNLYKMNYIKKGLDNKLYIIKKNSNGNKYWKTTTREERACIKDFEKNKNKYLLEYKDGNLVSNKQAIAIAYSKTYQKNSNCKKYLDNSNKKTNKKSNKKSQKKSNKKSKKKSNKKSNKKSQKKSDKKSQKNLDCRRKENKKYCKK